MTKKHISLTTGEPAGIGPDIACMLTNSQLADNILIISDPEILVSRYKKLFNKKLNIIETNSPNTHIINKQDCLKVYPIKYKSPVKLGEPNPDHATQILESLDIAINLCKKNITSAMTTGPINKANINNANINFNANKFTGHTNYIANKFNQPNPVMMFSHEKLKIALSTVHIPLDQVSKSCSYTHTVNTLNIIISSLKNDFNMKNPKIAVCGLNPHAGENGYLGHEDRDIISPAIIKAQKLNPEAKISGPLSADTLFYRAMHGEFDLVLAQYHDQGLPALKTISFGQAVNYTMGIPIIRTSVDHGTAEHLAGTGKANPGSLIQAILLAIKIAEYKNIPTKILNTTNKPNLGRVAQGLLLRLSQNRT